MYSLLETQWHQWPKWFCFQETWVHFPTPLEVKRRIISQMNWEKERERKRVRTPMGLINREKESYILEEWESMGRRDGTEGDIIYIVGKKSCVGQTDNYEVVCTQVVD